MIYLVTGAGEPNFGDELIVLNWIKYYRSCGYKGPIFVDCKSATGARKLHPDHDNVQFGRYFKAMTMGKSGDIAEYILAGRQFVDAEVLGEDVAGSDLVNQARQRIEGRDRPEIEDTPAIVHLVGGGYINGDWPNSFALLGAASQMARRLKCPIVGTGLGISPLSNLSAKEKYEVANAISDFEFIEMRDRESLSLLFDLGADKERVLFGYDDCFLYEPNIASNFKGRSLHVSTFGAHLAGSAGHLVLNTIRENLGLFDRILCWQCNVEDKKACEIIEGEFSEFSVKRIYNRRLLYGGIPFAKGDMMITSRFHPHILAARAGLAGYFLSFSGFYSAKHQSVVDIGSRFEKLSRDKKFEFPMHEPAFSHARTDADNIAKKREIAARAFSLLRVR